jgi:hypothetical protein
LAVQFSNLTVPLALAFIPSIRAILSFCQKQQTPTVKSLTTYVARNAFRDKTQARRQKATSPTAHRLQVASLKLLPIPTSLPEIAD